MKDQIEKLRERAVEVANSDADGLQRLVSEPYFSDDCKTLLQMMLEWSAAKHDDRKQYFWEMWHNAINTDPRQFISSISGFFSHEILDDGGYVIKWMKPFTKNRELEWLPGGGFREVEVGEEDPDALPQVFISSADDNNSDPKLLIETMNKALERQQRKQREREESAEKIRKFMSQIKWEK